MARQQEISLIDARFSVNRPRVPLRHTGRHRTVSTAVTRLCLLAVLLGLVPLLASPTMAQQSSTQISYLPWVSNGETIGGQGPWYGLVSVQNRSDDFCSLQVFVAQNGRWISTAGLSLTDGESRSISASGMSVPSMGGPVRLQASCEIAVSLKQYTPNARPTPWSDGAQVVTGYTGLSDADLEAAQATEQSAWFLPIVQTNSGWNTFLRISNFAETSSNVTVEIFPNSNPRGADGVALTMQRQVGVADSWTIDMLSSVGYGGFIGFARITTDGDIGVIAQRVKPATRMAITNVAIAADGAAGEGSYRAAAPLLFNAYNGWNTGITLANTSLQPAVVTLQYFPSDGAMLRQESIVIAALSMQYIYTPGTVDQTGFVGSATIISNVPVVAAVDEVKYETAEALSYMASGAPQHIAGIPIVFRESPANGLHDNSGISIVNLDPLNDQIVQLRLRDRSGNELLDLPIAIRIPPGGSSFIYLPFIDEFPAGTVASAILESSSAAGFAAISNDINYAAAGDGSVVFSASGNGGVFHIKAEAQ